MTENSPHITHTTTTHITHLTHITINPNSTPRFFAIAMISVTFPPPQLRIILVGLIESNNGRKCDVHPDGCGNSLVLERSDNGVGMELRLRMKVADELACYVVRRDGTDGCRVGFAAKEYAAGEKGAKLDGVIVRIVDVFLPDNPNRTARRLYHHNRGYTVAENVSVPFGKKE